MAEYLFTYHKFPQFLSRDEHNSFIQNDEYCSGLLSQGFLTLGNFDKLTIENVSCFNRTRNFSEFSKTWTGDRLSLLLYDLSNTNTLSELGFSKLDNGIYSFDEKSFNFIALTFFNISDQLLPKDYSSYESFQEYIQKQLKNQESVFLPKNRQLKYSLMGTMGSADFCIIWLAENHEDVLHAVELLKSVKITFDNDKRCLFLFSRFYTNFSLNNHRENNIVGKASLLVARKSSSALDFKKTLIDKLSNDYRNEIESLKISSVPGEYDLIVRGNAGFLISLIENGKNGIFDFKSEFYQDNITHTQIILERTNTELSNTQTLSFSNLNVNLNANFELIESEEIVNIDKVLLHKVFYKNNENKSIRDFLKENFQPFSCFVDDFDAFFCDLRAYMYSGAKLQRRLDCAFRFNTMTDIITGYFDSLKYPNYPEQTRDNIRDIIQIFHNQLRQERELNVPDPIDSPACQGNYNGFQDLLLHCYNNFLKELLLFIKNQNIPGYAQIVPVVKCSTVFQIESKQFSVLEKPTDPCIVFYSLPTAVMTDVTFGIASILHETFHYVPPKLRKDRNILCACPILCELTLKCFCEKLAEIVVADSNTEDKILEEVALSDSYIKQCRQSDSFSEFEVDMLDFLLNCYNVFKLYNKQEFFSLFCESLHSAIISPNKILQDEPFFLECLSRAKKIFFDCLNNLEVKLETKLRNQSSELFRVKEYHLEQVIPSFSNALSNDGCTFLETITNYYIDSYLLIFNEIKADVGMIAFSRMDIVDYLIIYSENHLLYYGAPQRLTEAESFRIFMIFLFFCECNEHINDLSTIREEFVDRYTTRFFSKTFNVHDEENKIQHSYSEYESEANAFFNEYLARIGQLDKIFSPYKAFFSELFNNEIISTNYNDSDKLLEATRELFNSIRKSEKKARIVNDDIGKTKSAIADHQREEFGIFQKFICHMQKTVLLKNIF